MPDHFTQAMNQCFQLTDLPLADFLEQPPYRGFLENPFPAGDLSQHPIRPQGDTLPHTKGPPDQAGHDQKNTLRETVVRILGSPLMNLAVEQPVESSFVEKFDHRNQTGLTG